MNISYFYNQNVEIEKYKRNKTKNRSPKHMRLLQSSFKALWNKAGIPDPGVAIEGIRISDTWGPINIK